MERQRERERERERERKREKFLVNLLKLEREYKNKGKKGK